VIVVLWVFFIVVFGVVEHLVDPDTFDTVWLGMWWGVETVTTVGYGDVVPQDTGGKVIAVFLMLGGALAARRGDGSDHERLRRPGRGRTAQGRG
jgi:voltage-gated potassium channel Kch